MVRVGIAGGWSDLEALVHEGQHQVWCNVRHASQGVARHAVKYIVLHMEHIAIDKFTNISRDGD